MNVIWLDPALSELASIREYIAINSPVTAEEFTLELTMRLVKFLSNFLNTAEKFLNLKMIITVK